MKQTIVKGTEDSTVRNKDRSLNLAALSLIAEPDI